MIQNNNLFLLDSVKMLNKHLSPPKIEFSGYLFMCQAVVGIRQRKTRGYTTNWESTQTNIHRREGRTLDTGVALLEGTGNHTGGKAVAGRDETETRKKRTK